MAGRGAQPPPDRLGEPGGRQSEPGAVGGRVEGAGGRALSPGGVAGETPGPEKRLADQIIAQGEQRQSAGAWVPDGDWREKVRKNLPWRDACLTGEGIELAFPQGAIAPMAEGNPTFVVKG